MESYTNFRANEQNRTSKDQYPITALSLPNSPNRSFKTIFRVGQDNLLLHMVGEKTYRVRCSTLQLSKDRGGLALPCLKDYYYSAQLRLLVCLCDSMFKSRWKDIEERATNGPPIQAMITDSKLHLHFKDPDNLWIKFTFKIWNEVCKEFKLNKSEMMLRWCALTQNSYLTSMTKDFKNGH